jgi:hypothetical protein
MSLLLVAAAAGAGSSLALDVSARALKLALGVDPTNVRNVGGLFVIPLLLLAHFALCVLEVAGHGVLFEVDGSWVSRGLSLVSLVAGVPALLVGFFLVRALLPPVATETCPLAHPTHFDSPTFRKVAWHLQPEQLVGNALPTDFPNVREATKDGALVPVDIASLYKDRPLVLEMGSISCPIFCLRIAQMLDLEREFGDRVNFVVLYGGEAHPSGGPADPLLPADPAQEVRAKRVERLRSELGLKRRALVDGADGAMQGRFGFMPNGVAVVDKTGKVTFWSRWNYPVQTRLAVRRVLGEATADEPAPKSSPPGAADMVGLGFFRVLGLLYHISGLVGLADLCLSLPTSLIGGAIKQVGLLPVPITTEEVVPPPSKR